MNHTIAAIATPQAAGGIGVIRISGPKALQIADAVFQAASGLPLAQSKGYRAHFGRVFHESGPIDEAIALVFRAPHSYTGEDVVELSCHGGLFLLQQALRAVFQAGASPAAAGEFTRRAFLNGKMDLTQAESVMGLIGAQGSQAARAALSAHDGALSREIHAVSQSLLKDAAHMAAWADYPEDELPELNINSLNHDIAQARQRLSALLAQFDTGRAVTQGVDTVICGRPNVGKSTLMNILGCLDRPTKGSYQLDGEEVATLDDARLAFTRNQKIGFVFQSFNLLPRLSALDNVILPMIYGNVYKNERKQRAQRMLEAVGLGDRIHHMPAEMSGGQRQRVAIARSLINDPSIIMADEPTGNLDSKSTKEVMEIFSNLYQSGKTVILVTHELGVANYAERHVILSDGHISKDIRGKLE